MQLWSRSRKLKRGEQQMQQPPQAQLLLGSRHVSRGRLQGRAVGQRSDWPRIFLLLLCCLLVVTVLQLWTLGSFSPETRQDTMLFPGMTAPQSLSWYPSSGASSSSSAASNSTGRGGRRGLLFSAFGHLHHGNGQGGNDAAGRPGHGNLPGSRGLVADTLVVYIYSATDPEYGNNLRHFLREGVREDDGCEYVFIIQEMSSETRHMLPILPRGSRYLFHVNNCFDWGSFGWALEEGHIHPEQYKYIIFMNSSVRGPFLPSYWPRNVHWSRVLTSRITDEIKLVGPTISCEGTDATDTHPARINPHVQSYVVAMDQVAFQVMRDAQTVFQCHHTIWDTIYHAELGSSAAVLNAGYNIDSLMLRFKGVDWRDPNNWGCNGGVNPYDMDKYDGVNINPLEVMFVKVKEFMLQAEYPAAQMAKAYDQWSNQMAPHPVNGNRYLDKLPTYAKRHVWSLRLHNPSCFDLQHYLSHNIGLPPWEKEEDAFNHFVGYGQFEGRPWRLKCDDLLDTDPSGNGKPILPDASMVQHLQATYMERQAQRQAQQLAVEHSMQVAAQGSKGRVWDEAAGGARPVMAQQQGKQAVQHRQPGAEEEQQQPPPDQRQQRGGAASAQHAPKARAANAQRTAAEEQQRLAMRQQQHEGIATVTAKHHLRRLR